MSDEHADFLNGLHVVEYELERVIGELDELHDRNGIPALDRVSLGPLQWALHKLADDLHEASAEKRNARLEVASAKREADQANEQHAIAVRKYDAAVKRGLALETQLAELTKKLGELPPDPTPEPYQWQVGDEIESSGFTRRRVVGHDGGGVVLDGMGEPLPQPEWQRRGWKLHRKASDLPDIPPFTEQQVAEFAAVTEPIDDSVGTNGEGQP